jgi:nucleoside-diphosphate-sugar epimerase
MSIDGAEVDGCLRRSGEQAVVTGCAGFIGSHLTERLLALGWDVVGVDCFTEFYDRGIKEENLAGVLEHPRFRLVEADLSRDPLEHVVAGADVVFHLAAQAGVRDSFGVGFAEYVRHNVLATQRLLEVVTGLPLRRFVYASSSSVYGAEARMPTPEHRAREPRSPYGMTKVSTEELAAVYHREFGVPVVGLRYFTVYGPRQRPDMAFTRFISGALAHEKIAVYGDGRQTRDFTYVADAVGGTLAAAVRGRPGAVYNIGGGTRVSVVGALEELARILDRPLDIVRLAGMRGDVRSTCADATLARRELRFSCGTSFREGLARQVEWLAGTTIRQPWTPSGSAFRQAARAGTALVVRG